MQVRSISYQVLVQTLQYTVPSPRILPRSCPRSLPLVSAPGLWPLSRVTFSHGCGWLLSPMNLARCGSSTYKYYRNSSIGNKGTEAGNRRNTGSFAPFIRPTNSSKVSIRRIKNASSGVLKQMALTAVTSWQNAQDRVRSQMSKRVVGPQI